MQNDHSDRTPITYGEWIPREPSTREVEHSLGIRYVVFESADGCEVRFRPFTSDASGSSPEREAEPNTEDYETEE